MINKRVFLDMFKTLNKSSTNKGVHSFVMVSSTSLYLYPSSSSSFPAFSYSETLEHKVECGNKEM